MLARYLTNVFLDGIVDESSDEDESDEEVLDLSASEEERDLLELYESEDEPAEDFDVKDPSSPSVREHDYMEKPLPPLPNTDSEEFLEPVEKSENTNTVDETEIDLRISKKSGEESTDQDGLVNKNEQALPLFSSESEESEKNDYPDRHQGTVDTKVADATHTGSMNSNSGTSPGIEPPAKSPASDSANSTNEAERHDDDKAR